MAFISVNNDSTITSGGGDLGDANVWIYADLAAATAGQGDWSAGDTVKIGPQSFVKLSGMTTGHGLDLCPEYPLGIASGRVASATLVESWDGGDDPRISASYTDSSAGVEDTDYSVDVVSTPGSTIFKKLTTTGALILMSPVLTTASDAILLLVVDGMTYSDTMSNSSFAMKIVARPYVSGATVQAEGIWIKGNADTYQMVKLSSTFDDSGITHSAGETVWDISTATVASSTFGAYRHALYASQGKAAHSNSLNQFSSSALAISEINVGVAAVAGTSTLTISGGVSIYRLTLAT